MSACSSAITTEMMDLDQQLAQLLGTMSLQNTWSSPASMARDEPSTAYASPKVQDECMSDSSDTEDSPYQSNLPPQPTSSPVGGNASQPSGCGLLQAIIGLLHSDRYPTTGGDYLEIIFTHREILYAYPQAHRDCALGFSDLADLLERRDWRADREGDAEAVVAFRSEAGMIAHTVPW